MEAIFIQNEKERAFKEGYEYGFRQRGYRCDYGVSRCISCCCRDKEIINNFKDCLRPTEQILDEILRLSKEQTNPVVKKEKTTK